MPMVLSWFQVKNQLIFSEKKILRQPQCDSWEGVKGEIINKIMRN